MKTNQASNCLKRSRQLDRTCSLLLLFCLVSVKFLSAQPGPQFISNEYYYKIVDEAGKEISFQNDSSYRIYIADHSPVSRKTQEQYENQFSVYRSGTSWDVQINDFSALYSMPGINYNHPLEVAIIHQSDTIFLNQESYMVRKLQFIPGHYYFPSWSSAIFENLPQTTGEIRLMNLNQRNFLVSKEQYLLDRYSHEEREKLEESIAQRFIDSAFTVTKTVESIKSNKSFDPYPTEGFKTLYPTKEKDIFIGTVGFDMSRYNYSRSNQVVCLFNRNDNTIEYKSPKDQLDFFYCADLFIDTFNTIYYQTVGFQENADPSCIGRNDGACSYTKQALRSVDGGKTWTEDKALTQLVKKHEYLKLDFLDSAHAVASIQADYFDTKKGHVRQVLYLLLRNGKIIDSFRSPAFIDHRGDYRNAFSLDLRRDSVILGQWNTQDRNFENHSYFSPMVVREEDSWKLLAVKYRQEHAPNYTRIAEVPTYANFSLENPNKLVFEHGSMELPGTNELALKPGDDGIYIFEDDGIVLLHDRRGKYTWFTLDKGKSWYFYPKALNEFYSDYNFLEMENGLLSVLSGHDLTRAVYQFTP